MAVSKYTGLEEITHAYEMGSGISGKIESKIYLTRMNSLRISKDLRWHFIGHLQRNKVKDLLKVDRLTAIHSVDSQALTGENYYCPPRGGAGAPSYACP